MGAGILPVALYRGTLFLLLGQERNNNNLWSDFGGSSHKGEKPFKTAIREGNEELNGFLIKPSKWIKGTKMAYAGLRKEKDRASVIKYLNQNSDNPVPLP